MDNVTDYILHIDNNSRLKLFTYLNRYINNKVYDTSFGDLVPLIVANAIKMNLIIIDKTNDECKCHIIPVVQNASPLRVNSVIIIKEGEHYNGLIYVSTCCGAGSEDLVNVGGGFTRLHEEYIDSKLPNVDNNKVNVNDMNFSHAEPHDNYVVTHSPVAIQNNVYEKCVQRFTKRELKFCSWNICGLTEANLYDDILGEFFKSFDFIFLTETCAYDIVNYNIDGSVFLNYSRHQMHHNARRNSGGIGIFIRNDIVDGVETKKTIDDVIVWIKLKHGFFGLPSDIYIVAVYIVPENSTHARHDPFGLLQNDIACIPSGWSQILLCGDYNAHTSVESDFMVNINEGSDGELTDYLCKINSERSAKISAMMEKNPLERFSQGRKNVDNFGKLLLELCKAAGMLILNGRLSADRGIGRCTRMADNSASVVDYIIKLLQ